MNPIFKPPIKKAHYVGTSVVLTIDQSHVKRLQIDDMTFFIQKAIENGIVLEMRKLNMSTTSENNVKSLQPARIDTPVQTAAAETPSGEMRHG
jgi:hypothetical protein